VARCPYITLILNTVNAMVRPIKGAGPRSIRRHLARTGNGAEFFFKTSRTEHDAKTRESDYSFPYKRNRPAPAPALCVTSSQVTCNLSATYYKRLYIKSLQCITRSIRMKKCYLL